MELLNLFNCGLKRYWSRRKNQPLDGTASSRRNVKAIRLGGTAKRSWRFRVIPKLRMKILSPVKLRTTLKNAYVNMMLNLGGNGGHLGGNGGHLGDGNVFGGKRIPKGREVVAKYSNSEFDNRLIYEIYKSVVPSMELYNH